MCNRLLQKFFRYPATFAQYKTYDIKKSNRGIAQRRHRSFFSPNTKIMF